MDQKVLMIFLGTLAIGCLFAFMGNLDSTRSIQKDQPLWMNLTANDTHITFSYDASEVEGFDSILLRTSWWDPRLDDSRELYRMESGLRQNSVSFPKQVTVSSPPMAVGITVTTHPSLGVTQGRQYVWKVTQAPLTLGLDDPIIDYIR